MTNTIGDLQKKINFIMKFAAALHSYGATAQGLEQAMTNIVAGLGLRSQFFATPTVIMASFETEDGQKQGLIRVKPSGIDLQKMLEIDKLGDRVINHEVDLETAVTQLEGIIHSTGSYANWAEVLAYVIAGAAISVLFKAGINEIVIASSLSLLAGLLAIKLSFHPQTSRFFEFLVAFVISFSASCLYVCYPQFSVELVTLASLIVFVPGLSLTISMTELATENLASGTARLMQAITVFMKLGFGVALGTTIMKLVCKDINFVDAISRSVPEYFIYPALVCASLAFTILFRAKLRQFPWMLLAGLIAYFSSYYTAYSLSPELSPFVGGFMVGLAANIYARYIRQPAAMIFMPGLIMLVPGSIGFRGLSFLVEKNTLAGIDTTFQMFMIAIALVGGLLLANVLVNPNRSL